jgi:hypothetical protein
LFLRLFFRIDNGTNGKGDFEERNNPPEFSLAGSIPATCPDNQGVPMLRPRPDGNYCEGKYDSEKCPFADMQNCWAYDDLRSYDRDKEQYKRCDGCIAEIKKKDNSECCRDEAFQRLSEYGVDSLADFDFNGEIEWWLKWARRREDQVAGWLVEVLQAIATEDFNNADEIRSFTATMLSRYAELKPKRDEPRGKDAVKDA